MEACSKDLFGLCTERAIVTILRWLSQATKIHSGLVSLQAASKCMKGDDESTKSKKGSVGNPRPTRMIVE
eukprot:5883506-Amphidinium_carterae.1